MKRGARRDKMRIYGDLLSILDAESRSAERIVLTHIQVKLKVPYDRLKNYLNDLEKLELIQDQISYRLTKKGRQYLNEYSKILNFMERMGIAYK